MSLLWNAWAIAALFAFMMTLGLLDAARTKRIRFFRWTYALDSQPVAFWIAAVALLALIGMGFLMASRIH